MFNPKKLLVGVLMFTLLAPQALAEQSGTDYHTVSFPVAAVNLVPNAYINMYKIVSTAAGIYAGELASSNTTGAQGEPVKFAVNSGDIVSFVAFTNKDKAVNVTRWNFTSAPYKNFSAEDGIGERLCQINGATDRSNSGSCVTSLNVPTGDNTVAIAAASLTASPLANFEVWVQQTNSPQTRVQDATVRLLDAGTREVIAQTTNSSRGVATFIIERGRKFYYEAYKDGIGYGGYTTQYTSTPRVFYISADKDEILGNFDGQRTSTMRLNAYPNPSLTTTPTPTVPPTTTPTPVTPPTNPTPYPSLIITEKPSIISPEQYQVLTNSPRNATITWKDIANAVSYELEIECDTCASGAKWSSRSPLYSVSRVSFTTEPLNANNMYRVHVRGVADRGGKGPWSDYRYFTYYTATTPTTPTPVAPRQTQESKVNFDYLYYSGGLSATPERGNVTLTTSGNLLQNSGYNFRTKTATDVAGGAFYLSDLGADGIARFFANNLGQGGLVDLGEISLTEATPIRELKYYYRFGLDIYRKHTYAFYDAANNVYGLIYVVDTTNTTTVTPPATTVPAVIHPTSPATPQNEDDDDFVEYNEGNLADIDLQRAVIQYGRRVGTSQYGFRSSVKFNNSSDNYKIVMLNAKCTTTLNGAAYSLMNTTKVISSRPGQKTFTFFEAVNDSQREALLLSRQNNGAVNCTFSIGGILDDYTNMLIADADASNNIINLELAWKNGRLQINTMGRN